MSHDTTRRLFLAGTAGAGGLALAGCLGNGDDDDTDDDEEPTEEEDATYEIWAADQGTDEIYIYEGTEGSDEFEHLETIDVDTIGGRPHMVHYTSDYEYAAIANAGGPVIVRTEDREIVAEIETGAGSHFAGFSPDDEYLVVDVIGDNSITRIDVDLEEEEFQIEDELIPSEEVDDISDTQNPVCHSYDSQGRSIHTLGPGYGDGGIVIVDHDDFEIVEAWPGEEDGFANCGTIPHPSEDKFYLTGGLPSDPDEDVDGVGEYYVLDTETDEITKRESAGGIDTHGFWYADGGDELWVLNRETNDGIVIDPDTDEEIETIEEFGPDTGDAPDDSDAPDIMWASPDGEWMFVTLRGPNPVTGGPHAATGVTAGVSVLDTETKDIETVIEPNDHEDADFHGIGVRPVDDFDTDIDTSPPF